MNHGYIIDLFEFARNGRLVTGDVHLMALSRMLTAVPEDVAEAELASQVFHWRIEGFENLVPRVNSMPQSELFLKLALNGPMWLECQRCLMPYQEFLTSETTFKIVTHEVKADDISLVGQDKFEVLVGSKQFDMKILIEEELLLSMPIVPKHSVCPVVHASLVTGSDGLVEPLPQTSKKKREICSPFSVLASLKRPLGKHGK
ncbi:hypothetical protein BZL35_00869 [Candidatus Pandoraea novymonadis]|uniref:Large ribosomal RNA subunit accumulation protein YceD n=2 Tax=Candidatus Pandoraea novymonadis TaxID=1808959 RepID=A0ABX5FF52_9BURK|nr:hypothetical protein BZL35_00869 [Candidatus Pandoraea novymonadis]